MVSAVKDFDQQQSAVSYGDPGCHAGQYLVADAILIFTEVSKNGTEKQH